jgi:hypothetical protein
MGKIYPGIHVWGVATSTVALLAGGWLMVAPFALGYQPSSADWTRATGNSFWVGLATVLVSLAGILLFAWSLVRQARLAGVIGPRRQPTTEDAGARARAAELDRTLVQLTAVLAADLAARRAGDAGHSTETARQVA